MNTALEYSTRVVQEGGRRCKKSTLNDLVHLTHLRIPLMNPTTVVLYTLIVQYTRRLMRYVNVVCGYKRWDTSTRQSCRFINVYAVHLAGVQPQKDKKV